MTAEPKECNYLIESEREVARARQRIEKQLELIDELKRNGRDFGEADAGLDTLVKALQHLLDQRILILEMLKIQGGSKH